MKHLLIAITTTLLLTASLGAQTVTTGPNPRRLKADTNTAPGTLLFYAVIPGLAGTPNFVVPVVMAATIDTNTIPFPTITPLGPGGQVQFVDHEVPVGVVNGTNATFTLQFAPNPATSLYVRVGGLGFKPGLDYMLSGSTITFLGKSIPLTGEELDCNYRR